VIADSGRIGAGLGPVESTAVATVMTMPRRSAAVPPPPGWWKSCADGLPSWPMGGDVTIGAIEVLPMLDGVGKGRAAEVLTHTPVVEERG